MRFAQGGVMRQYNTIREVRTAQNESETQTGQKVPVITKVQNISEALTENETRKRKSRIELLPEEERPYEKCLARGPESLTDSELLAAIIRTGANGLSSVELARQVLTADKQGEGLLGIHHVTIPELMQIRGIGQVKAIQIKCIGELSRRMALRKTRILIDFRSPQSIAEYYMETLRHKEQEFVICMMLNSRNQMIGEEIISKGTVNMSVVTPRDVLLAAFRYRAVSIVLIHNHPSGDPNPSSDDILITEKILEACELVEIPLLDHIVIGDRDYVSFAENNILKRTDKNG